MYNFITCETSNTRLCRELVNPLETGDLEDKFHALVHEAFLVILKNHSFENY